MAAGIPLSQAIAEYLGWLELDRAAARRTVAEYRADLGRFADFAGGDAGVPDVAGLDRELLRGYQRHLARLTTSRKGSREPLAASTRARRLVALRSFLRFAAREEWLPGDLGAGIDVPKLPERLPKPLADGARDLLLDALPAGTLPQLRDRAFILFLLSTGARIAEALRLDRGDWQPDRMRVIGKGDRERTVTVTEKARQAMEAYLGARTDPSPALFIGFQPARKNSVGNRSPCRARTTSATSWPCAWAYRDSTRTGCATFSLLCFRVAMAAIGGKRTWGLCCSTTSSSLPLVAEPRETGQLPAGQATATRFHRTWRVRREGTPSGRGCRRR